MPAHWQKYAVKSGLFRDLEFTEEQTLFENTVMHIRLKEKLSALKKVVSFMEVANL